MNTGNTILEVENLTKRFPGVIALKNVNYNLTEGEVHALCGENGAGKSTLIKILSGILPYGTYEGRVTMSGRENRFRGIRDAEKSGFAVIAQELALVPGMTVAENIFLGCEPLKQGLVDWHSIYQETQKLLDQFGVALDPAAEISNIGVGQQQLVEIVKALSKKPKILLLDEPTAALTEAEVKILLKIVKGLVKEGVACIYISHKLDEVFEISDRITVLRDGSSVATHKTKETDKSTIIRDMVGREINDFFPRRQVKQGRPLLKVENLSVSSAGPQRRKLLLDAINFEVSEGEVLGIGGLMGSGRTELLMHIFGVFGKRKSGKIILKEEELKNNTPAETIRRGIMMVSEDRKRYGLLTEKEIGFNLSLASLKNFTSQYMINEHAEFKENKRFFDSLGIKAPGQEETVENLSGGNQQKVVIGKALMTEPSVILLDEPTRGVDIGAKVDIYEIINRLTAEGKAVILVSSELPELMGMSDRIIILSEGKIGGEFSRKKATQEKLLEAAMAHH